MQEEQHWSRDGSYSAWHRRNSTMRFVGIEDAQLLAMIDLDVMLYVEYDENNKEPIALMEVAMDVGQKYKCATVTANLGKRASLPCYVVLYKLSDDKNPADNKCNDISGFRVKRLWPKPEMDFKSVTPAQWAKNLLELRRWQAKKIDSEYTHKV